MVLWISSFLKIVWFSSHSGLISDYKYLILSFEEAYLQHVHYEGNFSADVLAKARNTSLDVYSKFVSPATFVISQLLADIWGTSYPPVLCNFYL